MDPIVSNHGDAGFYLNPAIGSADAETPFAYGPAFKRTADEILEQLHDKLTDEVRMQLRGLDVGAVFLDELYVRHLKGLGLEPFSWDQVRGFTDDEATRFAGPHELSAHVIGVPARMSAVLANGRDFSSWYLRLPVFPVRYEPPISLWEPTWNPNEVPFDVRGVSGGPIVVTGLDQPFVAGIQYAQTRENGKKILLAADALPVFHYLHFLMEAVEKNQGMQGTPTS